MNGAMQAPEALAEQFQTGPAVLPQRIRKVVGIDLSMTATGVVTIEDGKVSTHLIKSKPDAGTLASFIQRSRNMAYQIAEYVSVSDLVLIEGMSFGSKSRSLDKIHGHWWLTVEYLTRIAMQEPIVVTPAARCKYATGKGNASKDTVLAAAVKRYPEADVTDNNIADALILAAMGARHLGRPIDDLPLVNLTAMDSIRWAVTGLGETA